MMLPPMSFRALLRDPLVHFLVLGAIAFAAWGWWGPSDARTVHWSASKDATLIANFEASFSRAPTTVELEALRQKAIDTEILVREAEQLGFPSTDVIVRRRLVQKMRFVLEDAGEHAATDAELREWMASHPDDYRRPAELDLEHIYVARRNDGGGDDGEARMASVRGALAEGHEPATLGDAFPHGRIVRGQSDAELARRFGPKFAASVVSLPTEGEWTELESSFGRHLVRVLARSEGGVPPLERVRARVEADWQGRQRELAFEAAMEQLRARYRVEGIDGAGG